MLSTLILATCLNYAEAPTEWIQTYDGYGFHTTEYNHTTPNITVTVTQYKTAKLYKYVDIAVNDIKVDITQEEQDELTDCFNYTPYTTLSINKNISPFKD